MFDFLKRGGTFSIRRDGLFGQAIKTFPFPKSNILMTQIGIDAGVKQLSKFEIDNLENGYCR